MKKFREILIVGAGPSGLSMAIFLADFGYKPRVIDKKSSISPWSKALGVNPRTLEILEVTGITDRFLSRGRKMEYMNLYAGEDLIYKIDLSAVKHKYPFMLILGQSESEEILRDALSERGIEVEYNSMLTGMHFHDPEYIPEVNNKTENRYNLIIGADGGHSKVREGANISFKGFSYDEHWELYDIHIEGLPSPDEGHIHIFQEGVMLLIRLKENLWRVAGNLKDILNYLPARSRTGTVAWFSVFRIHHKLSSELVKNNIALIGDAAHLHSPVGARGMNLGIEDAFILSKYIRDDRLISYNNDRLPYLDKTVKRINSITQTVADPGFSSRLLRRHIKPISRIFPLAIPGMRKFVMGLR